MRGAIEIKNKAKGERVVKALIRKQTRAKVDTETGIQGAGKQIETLQKDVAAFKKSIAGLSLTVGKLWRDKIEREMKDD